MDDQSLFLRLLCCVGLAIAIGCKANAEDEIAETLEWRASAGDAVDAARQSGRPLIVFVSSARCGYCRRMERESWTDVRVVSAMRSGFVAYRLPAEGRPDVVEKLGVRALPTTLVFSPQGELLRSAEGYLPPGRLVRMLEQAGNGDRKVGEDARRNKPATIAWAESETAAVDAARTTGRPIVAFVTSASCGYCRKMERESWSDARVVSAVDGGFVPFHVEAEKLPETVERLGVRAFPTTIVFSPQGRALQSAEGYLPPERLLGMLQRVATARVTPR